MYHVKVGWNTDIDVYEYWIMKESDKNIVATVSELENAKKIVTALNKQIPKKAIDHALGDYTIINYCQNCNDNISEIDNYCSICGQKIDWD